MKQHFTNYFTYAAYAILLLSGIALSYFIFNWLNRPYIIESVVFSTNIVPETSNDKPVKVIAQLFIPKEAKFPISAVVITPSSGGVEAERELYYATELTKSGIAALVVDSFRSRGLESSLYNQSLLESWQVENDAFAALKLLNKDDRFNKKHIAIMGVSKGGTAAMDSAFVVRRSWAGIKDFAFAAHIAISPECNWTMRSNETTGVAMLFLLAGKDNQTPIAPCLSKIDDLRKAGNTSIEVKVYEGVHHAWEELGAKPLYDEEVENYSKCRVWVEDDGQMVAADTGETIPEDWYSWAKENCMEEGAYCCGGNHAQKEKATRDIIGFLKRRGF